MKITDIKPSSRKKGFLCLYADGEYVMTLAAETVQKCALRIGREIDGSEIGKINRAVLVRRARERLLYSLDRRLHSERELREKLRRDYPPDIIDEAVAELARLGLVDDRKFAEVYAEELFERRGKGRYAVTQELYKKGVDREIIREVIDEFAQDEGSELDSAISAAEKYSGELDTPAGRKKAFAFLVRRGFSYSTASAALRTLCDDEGFFEE